MEYNNGDADRKRKIRIIAVTCASAVVVLGIAAFAIISAITGIGNGSPAATTIEAAQNAASGGTANSGASNGTSGASKSSGSAGSSNSDAKTETGEKSEASNSGASSEKSTETANTSNSSSATSEKKASSSNSSSTVASSAESVPTTGPADVAFSGVLMGVATFLILHNRQLVAKA